MENNNQQQSKAQEVLAVMKAKIAASGATIDQEYIQPAMGIMHPELITVKVTRKDGAKGVYTISPDGKITLMGGK